MNISDVQQIGEEVLKLLAAYRNPPHKELLVDAILLAYLTGRYSRVARQHHLRMYRSPRAQRIDFQSNASCVRRDRSPDFCSGAYRSEIIFGGNAARKALSTASTSMTS